MNVFCYPALVGRNPIFGALLGREARHHRGVTSGHDNFDAKCRVLLRNDPIGRSSMRMFFRHTLNIGPGYGNASAPCWELRNLRSDSAFWMHPAVGMP